MELRLPQWPIIDFHLRQAQMDGGLACETVDPETGVVKTGAAFATFAGFLAYALYQAGCTR